MTPTRPTTANPDPAAWWRPYLLATLIAPLVAVAVPALLAGADRTALLIGWALATGHGALGALCSRQALRGNLLQAMLWGIGGKLVRSLIFVLALVAAVLADRAAAPALLVAAGTGWFCFLLADLTVLSRALPARRLAVATVIGAQPSTGSSTRHG